MTNYACAVCLVPTARGMLFMYADGESKLIALCPEHMESVRQHHAARGVPVQDAERARLN